LVYTDFEVISSTTYRYKYRGRNINGWGDFSEVGYLFAAGRPSQPAPPKRVSETDTTIAIQLFAPTDTGGSDILAYELWMDAGTLNSVFT
jgi:hypothetical protein